MDIRSAVVTDFDRACELLDQLGHPLPADDGALIWDTILVDPIHDVFVAEIDGSVVALIDVVTRPHLHHGGLVSTVDSFVVDSAFRGEGIGTQLLETSALTAFRKGSRLIELTSGTARGDAHRFYERQQFTQNGVRFIRVNR